MELRSFIKLLGDLGRLERIERQVDWKFEVGGITRANREPLLFQNIKDYPGAQIFTNGLSSIDLIGLAIGLPYSCEHEVIEHAKQRIHRLLPPTLVSSGPALENEVPATEIDLLKLPVPQWSTQDIGRYIGTWHINVTKDPDNDIRNVGVYRMQVLGPKLGTVSTSPRSHLAIHMAKAEKKGQSLPMAVAIGVSETVVMAASAALPYGCDEYELAGGLEGRSLPLIKCGTVNLEVPAHSEIVIEGFLKPGTRVTDGPYFDYAGKTNTNANAFLFEATRLMHRNDPIFRGTSVGLAGAEDHQLFAFLAQLKFVDFHGRRSRQFVQNQFLKKRLFRAFQFAGRLGSS